MRNEDEMCDELEHIDALHELLVKQLLKDAHIPYDETMSHDERRRAREQAIHVMLEAVDAGVRNAYLDGVMEGRRQALEWAVGDSDELYKSY